MNAVGIKPLPGFATLRDGYLPGNAKARSVLRITAADGLQQAVRVDVNGTGNGKAKLDTLKPNGSPLGSILANGFTSNGKNQSPLSRIGNSTNIKWHECLIDKIDRQNLLNQKGCVIWITGLSGSGKSTVACHLSKILTQMGKLTYILDGDNLRHGLNSDLSFKAEDRAENIRRVGEVAKLFSDAGVICIACLISPYRRDREACRKILPNGDFIEVFMDVPLGVCESRDPKGLYKLARAGKIKGFTGIDDPYEPPANCEITLKCDNGIYASPSAMAEKVICYLEYNGYLQA
ncbi:hypothetical protein P3X46_024918 [Hevea brasiliensis]|uniref:Adenylyl-sulfate kinase n=1 Tax=Hevea brasiliensis TaxID=3981 RepID=A0ABQ9L5R4_HEVBR|nr:adenylyl-sulfate kinase 3 [Hevea brasiliensis]KAJ9159410.1 hypothetical protein P3X46_024918 [Hevea brasiliensis]